MAELNDTKRLTAEDRVDTQIHHRRPINSIYPQTNPLPRTNLTPLWDSSLSRTPRRGSRNSRFIWALTLILDCDFRFRSFRHARSPLPTSTGTDLSCESSMYHPKSDPDFLPLGPPLYVPFSHCVLCPRRDVGLPIPTPTTLTLEETTGGHGWSSHGTSWGPPPTPRVP